MTIKEDPRKTGLKNGLRQLTIEQLKRVIGYRKPMCLDTYNYIDGVFCPLAIAVELDLTVATPTNLKITELLRAMGFSVYNTRYVKGTFYTKNRQRDLMIAAAEVLLEKLTGKSACAKTSTRKSKNVRQLRPRKR